MSVKLRMKRMGRKKIPYFRLIAIDSRKQRDGEELDRVGVYNPLPEEEVFNVDEDKLFYWLEKGAEPSDTVRTLMKNHGLALKWHLKSQGKSEEEIEREYQKWQLLRESKATAKAEQDKREVKEVKEPEPEPEPEPEVEEPVADAAEEEITTEAGDQETEDTASDEEVATPEAADKKDVEDADEVTEAAEETENAEKDTAEAEDTEAEESAPEEDVEEPGESDSEEEKE